MHVQISPNVTDMAWPPSLLASLIVKFSPSALFRRSSLSLFRSQDVFFKLKREVYRNASEFFQRRSILTFSFFHLPLPWLAKVTHQRQQMALPWCSSLPVDIFEIYYQNFNWKQNSLYFRKWIRTFIITKNIPIRNEISSELKCLASLDFHV